MHFRYFSLPLFLMFLLSIIGCKYSTEYTTVNANNLFSVTIPPWMKADDKLKEGAPFQYNNRFRNIYAIGETVSSAKNFSDLNTEIIQPTVNALTNPVISDSVAVEINGMKGVRTEIYGKMVGENIYYSHLLLQGKNNIIHFCLWTRTEERKLKYKDDIERILASVKEL